MLGVGFIRGRGFGVDCVRDWLEFFKGVEPGFGAETPWASLESFLLFEVGPDPYPEARAGCRGCLTLDRDGAKMSVLQVGLEC